MAKRRRTSLDRAEPRDAIAVSGPNRVFDQSDHLLDLKRHIVPSGVLDVTRNHLQMAGRSRSEGALCWAGTPVGDAALITTAVLFTSSQHYGGIHVSPAESGLLYEQCNARGLTLFAQVHSHPEAAFHSQPDELLPHSPVPGFLSLVIPSFGRRCLERIDRWAIYEQVSFERWREWTFEERGARLKILDTIVRIA
jgi:hypothetical protein